MAGAGIWSRGAAALCLGALAAAPWLLESFYLFQMTQLLVYAVAILGLNMLTGISGQFSLGHGAFHALGAYTAAVLIEQAGIHYAATLPVAGLLCFAVGFLFGLPAVRLEGVSLALATFALAIATPQILKLSLLADLTGGVQGMTVFSATFETPVPFGLPLSSPVWTYFFVLGTALILYLLARNIVTSRTGRALLAIRENPIAAAAAGIHVARYKALAFAISAAITGIAGALGAIVVKFVAPDSFSFYLSILLFVGMVIGGAGWLPGALIGGAAIVFLPNVPEHLDDIARLVATPLGLADSLPPDLDQALIRLSGAIYGVVLLLVIYLAPEGAGGLVRTITTRLHRKSPPEESR